jgi:hypothetical protein
MHEFMNVEFVINQLYAQFFFMYVYFCYLHVSGSHVPIIRRINLSTRHLVCVTLYRRPFGSVINSHMSEPPKRPVAFLLPPVSLHIPSSLIYGLKNVCGTLQCRRLHIILFILLCALHLFPFRLAYTIWLNRACSLLRERP